MIKQCVVCGKIFETIFPHKITCSKDCSKQNRNNLCAKWGQIHRPPVVRTCVVCGKNFSLPAHCSAQKTCSLECSKELKRQRERGKYQRYIEKIRPYQREYQRTHKWKITPTVKCRLCGKPFKQRNHNHWFCSDDCIVEYFSQRIDRLVKLFCS